MISIPQVGEENTPQPSDAAGECLLYDDIMTRVFVADALDKERSALRLVLLDLGMIVVGEAADWPTTLTQAPKTDLNMLLVDWDMLPTDLGIQSLSKLRQACPKAIVVVLISHLDALHQAAISAGADAFISKGETPERVAERLRAAAESIRI
jgi:DNA-binding NarL/FixJ family response regulator